MSTRLAAVHELAARELDGPVHRSIVALDIESSTQRTNPVKGELRRLLYELLDRAVAEAGIAARHLEKLTDRGDGVLILVRPHDDVPKTVLLCRLIPKLAGLLVEHNAAVADPALRLRLRAVVHAGEVHGDGRGFYGEDLDIAFRLLDSPAVKKTLRDALAAPLVLVVSEEIYTGIIRHGYVDPGPRVRRVYVRVAGRRRRGWVHLPWSASPDQSLAVCRAEIPRPSPSLATTPPGGWPAASTAVSESEGLLAGQGSPGAGRRLRRSRRGPGWGRPDQC